MDLRKTAALELSRALQERQNAAHPLRQLFWECTTRCNFACRHCGSDCKATASLKDMPFGDFKTVLGSIAAHSDPHRTSVVITGGEPLVRRDLEDCGREIYDMGFPWGIVTNGWLLDRDRFRSLLKAGIHGMTVSLDGIGDTHDWMRGKEGSFRRASDAIRMVCDFNRACGKGEGALGFGPLGPADEVAFDVVSCINRRNVKQLEDIKEHLIALGLKSWRLFTIFPVGRAAEDPELQLDKDEFHTLMEFIKSTRKEGRIKASFACEGFLGRYEGEVRDHFFACQAGITIGSVLADGSIGACASIRSDYSEGNIYRGDDFWEVWQNGYGQYRDREWMRAGGCGRCRSFRWCRGGPMHLRDSEGRLLFCHLDRFSL